MEWGRVHITPEIEDEREAKDVNLGFEGSNSNGHGKEMAKAHRDDSQNLMKVRDQ
jgi:hypothetical protein